MIYFFRFLITALFLILFFFLYKFEIELSYKRNYYLIYFIGTCLTIFFLLFALYLNKKIQKYIIIIFISAAFTLYFFEAKLIFDQKKKSVENIKTKINNLNFDKRSKYEIFNDLKKTNLNITLSVTPNNFLTFNKDFLSLGGISFKETIHCNENGYYSIYQSDRYGFNNPDNEWDSKEIEFFLIGDSLTHGACVNRPNDIASVLRKYSKKNVLNLGQSGNGPLIAYATLKEYLPPNVKNVLWLYYEGNDLYELEKELKNNILNQYLINNKFKQDLKFKQTQIDQFLTTFLEKEKQKEKEKEKEIKRENEGKKKTISYDIVKFFKLSNTRNILIKPPSPLPPPEFKIILNLANELVQNHNGKLYFIYLPAITRYTGDIIDSKKLIKKIVSDLDIEFIDMDKEVFKKTKNPLKFFPFEKFSHYTVEGYKKISLKIYEKTR